MSDVKVDLVHVLKRNLKMATDRDLKKIRKLVKKERNRRELTKDDSTTASSSTTTTVYDPSPTTPGDC